MKNSKEIKEKENNYYKFLEKKFEEFNNNGKKTIAFFCDTFYPCLDGVIKVMDNYMKRLAKDYNIVACVPKHKKETFIKQEYLVLGAKSKFFKSLDYDVAFPAFDNKFKKILKLLRIDLIHSHSPFFMGSHAKKIALKRNIPLVMTFHSQFKQDFYKATKSKLLTKILLKKIIKVFNASTEVWTMSNKAKNVISSYGYKGKCILLPNATDMKYPENPQEILNMSKTEYKIKDDENVLLFVGRMVATKNILFIADALKLAKDKGFRFKMFYVGEGVDLEKLKQRIKENDLEKDVIQTGKLVDKNMLQSLYLRADLFVFPSVYDTSSLVQIEAATNKTPTLFIEGSTTSGDVKDEVDGFLCEEDVEKFADKIIDIFKDKQKLAQISEKAYQNLHISWDDVVKRAEQRYEFLLNNKKPLK